MAYVQLDDAFLKFVNFYVKEMDFKRNCDVFKKRDEIRELIKLNESDPLNPLKDDQIYWSPEDALDYKNEFISDDEALLKNREIVNCERLLAAPREFRHFLLSFDLEISFPKNGQHQTTSNKICSTLKCFSELVENRFESYRGTPLYLETDEFEKSMDWFFRSYSFLETKDSLFSLIGDLTCKEIFEKFPDENAYTERGAVYEYLSEKYGLSRNVLRTILPSLKDLKKAALPAVL
jgi:hypothetical protein